MILGVFGPSQLIGLAFIIIILAGVILLSVFYLLNLQNLLKQIKPVNRQVEPGNVWLMFIPLFNIIYPFILYPKITDSVKLEMESRGMAEQGDYGRGIGIALPILGLCGIIPVIGTLASIANLVLFIIFWVKMAGYKTKLMTSSPGQGVVGSDSDLLDK